MTDTTPTPEQISAVLASGQAVITAVQHFWALAEPVLLWAFAMAGAAAHVAANFRTSIFGSFLDPIIQVIAGNYKNATNKK